VRGIIRNRTYAGQRKAHETVTKVVDGVETTILRRGKGATRIAGLEPVVSAKLWETANARLDNAPRGKRGTTVHPPALLTSAAECGVCGGRIYRIFSGHDKWRTPYYRCNGQPPLQKGCGLMVRLDVLDALVDNDLSTCEFPVAEYRLIPGTAGEIEERLSEITYELRDLPALGLDEDTEDARRAALRAERRQLEAALEHAEPSRWALAYTINRDGEPVTYASRWKTGDFDARRAMLRDEFRIVVKWSVADDGRREPVIETWPLGYQEQRS
jgi:hypothetical protein